MNNEKLVTKNNHYFPKFLIRNWKDNNGKVCKMLIDSGTPLLVSPDENLFEKRIYDNKTETQTSKDDTKLSIFIRRLKADIDKELGVFQDDNFLQLIFKLFARQPALNKASYNSVKDAIINEPYLSLGVKRNENIFEGKDFKRFVNNAFLTMQDYDISSDWIKAKYRFVINNTDIPFILPDNTKTLLLPLTPSIAVGISSLTENEKSVNIEKTSDEKTINLINDLLLKNCDTYYIKKL